MPQSTRPERRRIVRAESGFSLPELLIAVTILLIISSTVTTGLLQLTSSQKTIANRTEMHSGVRSATELLQQEIGQAGRIALPGTTVLTGPIAAGAQTVTVTQTIGSTTAAGVSGIFVGEQLIVDAATDALGNNVQETVTVTAVNTASHQITATFANSHTSVGAVIPVKVYGGFATGIVPPSPGYTNGSTGTVLKLYGDINGDGNMVYIEYTCDTVAGNLYRNVMPYDQATAKVAPGTSQVLLNNILTNPGGTACFSYMPNPLPVVNGNTYVLDVAVTLTVQTQQKDPITQQFQTETKALLNVSPRNVFNVWQLDSAGISYRVQPIPPSVTALLP
jgi:prepilin-type N-terminal cleavage/methylation domain-containing protein